MGLHLIGISPNSTCCITSRVYTGDDATYHYLQEGDSPQSLQDTGAPTGRVLYCCLVSLLPDRQDLVSTHPASLHKNVPGVKVSTLRGKIGQAGVMDLGGASEQSRPDRSLQIGQRTCERQEPFRHLLREVDKQSSPWSLLETKQETVSYGPEEVLFQCESGWQMEHVASRSHWHLTLPMLMSSRVVCKGYVMPRWASSRTYLRCTSSLATWLPIRQQPGSRTRQETR